MVERPLEPHVRVELLSQPRLLASIRALINSLSQRLGFRDIHCGQISLAVDEALCNIINHGYERRPDGRIWINIWSINEGQPQIRIMIEDQARQVDPQTIRSRNLEDIRPGGLGVYIIKEVMDEVKYEKREGGGMRLTMTKRLPGPGDQLAPSSANAFAAAAPSAAGKIEDRQ